MRLLTASTAMRILLSILALLLLTGCDRSRDDGVVDVAIIGEGPDELFTGGLRLPYAGQHMRAATMQGLVAMNQAGQIVPAIAERWIVTDDGSSYIFRIREFDLPDGTRLTAQTVRDSLRQTISRLDGTSMGLDLAKVRDVRAMTGRVVEVRLKSPMPGFLQLLAQPEMGVAIEGARSGPMSLRRNGDIAVLDALAPEQRGLPRQPEWEEGLYQLQVVATDVRQAIEGFDDGRFDVVLGGRLATLPLTDTGGLSRGTIRLDSAIGLFGLDVRKPEGFLASPENREALSMALDRAALIQPFNIAGWVQTTRIVAPGMQGEEGAEGERWADMTIEAQRSIAAQRVNAWKTANAGNLVLTVGLPEGPGSDILFDALARQWATIGVGLSRVQKGQGAQLELRDRVARYGGARWFLNQFNCEVSTAICSPDVDFLVELAVESRDPAESASYLAEAEETLSAFNAFIPFGAPIRWSLVRADAVGFAENPWGLHPLFPLSRAPI